MSSFDEHRSAFAPDLVGWLGDSDAVAVSTDGPKYTAIVDELRIERVTFVSGAREIEEDRETCRVKITCPRGAVGPRDRLHVAKHSTGNPANYDQEKFTVLAVERQDDVTTVVQLGRRPLAKVQQAGTEARG